MLFCQGRLVLEASHGICEQIFVDQLVVMPVIMGSRPYYKIGFSDVRYGVLL